MSSHLVREVFSIALLMRVAEWNQIMLKENLIWLGEGLGLSI